MPSRKKNHKEDNDTLPENASPVCYIHSSELRPEFKEEGNETLKTQANAENNRKINKPGKESK